ncbi:hypothetical protein [Sphingomonas edaphi]|uniref:META domain-containing protein n=1 Tax=Sphingomonas edaphi TaxID=2315689 RepID=A0A418Q3S2_9SPHN|nr:hypothetical protein [Sphingomonas edaphi]RIX32558.1 hypothetical protein D3M59_06410 [Sphingomonas edaphi]
MKYLLPLITLMLAACNQQDDAPAPVQNEPAETPAAAEEVPSLEGSWNVTMAEGRDASAMGMTASFAGGSATLSTGCFRRGWTYTQQRNAVAFTTSPSGSSNCGGSRPGASEEGAFAALAESNIAIFGKEGKEATLSGTAGTLTLERR